MSQTTADYQKYDKLVRKKIEAETINYGIIFGNEKIVFIKTGVDGDIRGYKDKYLKISHRVHERMGATVICASNPETVNGHFAADKEMISYVASELKHTEYMVYFLGVSDGAYHNIVLATEIPQTMKILGISTSRKTVEDFKEKLQVLAHIEKILVYGTEDYEYDVVPMLKDLECENLKVMIIEGADHDFKGMLDEFITLSDVL
jgi:hypothetical protein